MDTHFVYSCFKGIHYELYLVAWHLLNDLLNHMIPILIFHTEVDIRFEFIDENFMLSWCQNFECFLGYSTSILILTETEQIPFQLKVKHIPLLCIPVFKHLLENIVTKDIFHQALRVSNNLIE